MDIKNTFDKYTETAGCSEKLIPAIKESIEVIKKLGIPYEFRTTVIREMHTESDIEKMCAIAGDTRNYFLQSYEESDNVIEKRFSAYSAEEFESMIKDIKGIKPNLRGIE